MKSYDVSACCCGETVNANNGYGDSESNGCRLTAAVTDVEDANEAVCGKLLFLND